MLITTAPITIHKLNALAKKRFGNMVKAVVDTDKGIMALDADLHADEEAALLDKGSKQEHLWGINLYPEFFGTGSFIEFDSLINVRPSLGNLTRGIDNSDIRLNIRTIVSKLIKS